LTSQSKCLQVCQLCRMTREIKFYKNYFIDFYISLDSSVVLFNGFQKKSQKTPKKEIKKALRIKEEYFKNKKGEGK